MHAPAAPEDLEVAERLVRGLARRLGSRLLGATLFGSRARGMAWSGSDYDIFLLIDREDPAARRIVYDVAYDYFPMDFNFHIYTPDRLEQALRIGSPVLRDVEREGVPLWPATAASKPIG